MTTSMATGNLAAGALLHAAATQSVSGFLASSDKVIYDGVDVNGWPTLKSHSGFTGSGYRELTRAIRTTDAAAVVVLTIAIPDKATYTMEVWSSGSSDSTHYDSQVTFVRATAAGTTINISTIAGMAFASGAPGGLSFVNNFDGTMSIKVAGIAATIMDWDVLVKLLMGVTSNL
jgi:hypothetical protein